MTRILMRSKVNLLEAVNPARAIASNVMNGNCGNMVFAHSLTRALYREDTQIDYISFNAYVSAKEIDRINQTYDFFILPLANAFRPDFCLEFQRLTLFIKKLTIPCIVIGIGSQFNLNESPKQDFVYNEDAKAFIKAVLEKSAQIGIRGEFTAEYLQHLGFTPEKDFSVIGCPSMFLHGETIPLKPISELTPKSKVAMNRKINFNGKLHQFLYDTSQLFDDCIYIGQGIDDLSLIYAGRTIKRSKFPNIHPTYPWNNSSPFICDNREVGFVNVVSWMKFLSERDFSFGTKIHGSITSILSGTPAYIFATDKRILELARYHNIPHMSRLDMKDDTNIFDLYEKADFSDIQKGHIERFHHYLDFLEINGLPHIFGEKRKNRHTAFDTLIENQEFPEGIWPYANVSFPEKVSRRSLYLYYKCIELEQRAKRFINNQKIIHTEELL